MRKEILLQNLLKSMFSFMHKKRQDVLFGAVDALLEGADLTLTDLGRKYKGIAKERHQIRKIDRLLGNKKLHNEILPIYRAINARIISKRPIIAVDWSCLCYAEGRYLLRASMCITGRSQVCYQEVHPRAHENNTDVHNKFLDNLRAVLPADVQPIILTDAIFSALWFKKVLSFGWDFIGRVRRNRGSYFDIKKNNWFSIEKAFQHASTMPSVVGEILLTKRNKLFCRLVAYKKILKGRKIKNRKGKLAKGSYNTRQAQSNREPWLLVTSIAEEDNFAEKIVRYYAKRMQIEEEFRDTKSERFGFGLSKSRTKIFARIEVLLIINLLASLLCWVLACHTIKNKQHVDYHANSSKQSNILSAIRLGKAVYKRLTIFPLSELKLAFKQLICIISQGEECY